MVSQIGRRLIMKVTCDAVWKSATARARIGWEGGSLKTPREKVGFLVFPSKEKNSKVNPSHSTP